jgi:hypothetical protein
MQKDSVTAAHAEEGREKPDMSEVNSLSAMLAKLKEEASMVVPQLQGTSPLDYLNQQAADKRRNDIMGLGTSVKGGFTATAAAQQFGVGDKTDKVIDGLNNVAETNKATKTAIESGFATLTSALRMH